MSGNANSAQLEKKLTQEIVQFLGLIRPQRSQKNTSFAAGHKPILSALVVSFLLLAAAPKSLLAQANRGTSRKVLEAIDNQLLPAYERGDSFAVLAAISPLVSKLDPTEFEALAEVVKEKGLPSLDKLLLESRIGLIHQQQFKKLPKPALREAELLIPAILQEIEVVKEEFRQNPVAAGNLPTVDDLEEYEGIFWQLHVLQNRLRNAGRLLQYADAVLSGVVGKKMAEDSLSVFATFDPGKAFAQLDHLYDEVEERRHLLRIRRLGSAGRVLTNSDDFRQRLLAAFFLDIDGFELNKYFSNSPTPKLLALQDPGLYESTKKKIEALRSEAGDLLIKSRLLYVGLHWWMRGRYGSGPDGMGLLKSRLALVSPQAQFGLYMPSEPPVPTEPSGYGEPVPSYSRRHHYIWMYEYRQAGIESSMKHSNRATDSDINNTVTQRTTLAQFY